MSVDGRRLRGWTRAALVEELAEVAQEVGGRPTQADVEEHADVSPRTVYRNFENWDAAVSVAVRDLELGTEE